MQIKQLCNQAKGMSFVTAFRVRELLGTFSGFRGLRALGTESVQLGQLNHFSVEVFQNTAVVIVSTV